MKKIGARLLDRKECTLILPSYEIIFKQIESFRAEAGELYKKKDSLSESIYDKQIDQKTNNIGILGCRGAGKTSLLKTVREDIRSSENRSKNDILLPIIVPENISNDNTLIGAILGMFAPIVDDRHKEYQDKLQEDYLCEREDQLLKQYNEVIKQYTYIQKEYRNILLNQFTSENDYVKKSTQVFNSDTEFINKWNEFIALLLKPEQEGEKGLIFLFIDDVDLSTHRSSDVVKTLLFYLSNPRIVTFISGDMETFEEALTLEFLRLEGALHSNILEQNFLEDSNKTLLNRKRILAYEYLKKVIPPVFRHSIKRWTLEEREKFEVSTSSKSQASDEKTNDTLGNLLCDCLEKYIDRSYFKYIDFSTQTEVEKPLSYIYYLFDDTSRGLNNVYNVLLEIKERKDNNEISIIDRKLLIETIVASNPVYNGMREEIFTKIIHLANTEEDSKVEFVNAKFIMQELYNQSLEEKISKEVFQLFLLTDFSYRLIYGRAPEETDDDYLAIKKLALRLLLSHSNVSNRMSSDSLKIKLRDELEEFEFEETLTKELGLKEYILCNLFLTKLELNLYLFETIEISKVIDFLNHSMNKESTYDKVQEKELSDMMFQHFYYAIHSYCGLMEGEGKGLEDKLHNLIGGMFESFSALFHYIQKNISKDFNVNVFEMLCAEIINEDKGEDRYNLHKKFIRNTYYAFYQSLLAGLNNAEIKSLTIQTLLDLEYPFKDLEVSDNIYKLTGNSGEEKLVLLQEKDRNTEMNRIKVIRAISEEGLWKIDYSRKTKKYILDKFREFSEYILKKEISLDAFKESFDKFISIYKGVSITKAESLEELAKKNEICDGKKELSETASKDKIQEFYSECASLASNYRVWYGRYEASEMQYAIHECRFDIKKEENIKYYQFLLIHYIILRLQETNIAEISKQAEINAQLFRLLSESNEKATMAYHTSFMEHLNKGIEKLGGSQVNEKDFNKLFDK